MIILAILIAYLVQSKKENFKNEKYILNNESSFISMICDFENKKRKKVIDIISLDTSKVVLLATDQHTISKHTVNVSSESIEDDVFQVDTDILHNDLTFKYY